MKRAWSNWPIFYKYLASYIVVLIIPIVLLGYFGYQQLVQIEKHEVSIHNREMLKQIQTSVDTKMLEMNKIAAQITVTPELTPFSITENFFNAYQAKPILDYRAANDFIYETLLYIRGQDYLYSTASTYRLPIFINDIYRYSGWDQQAFTSDLNTIARPTLRPAEDVAVVRSAEERFVTYLVPIPAGSGHPYGTVMFMIKENALLNYLDYDAQIRDGNTIIFDEHHDLIASSKRESYLGDQELYRLLAAGGEAFATKRLQDTDFFVTSVKSEQTGWTYVTLLPVPEVMRPINEAVAVWGNTLLIIVLIGSAITYGIMYFNYNPVKKLVKVAEKHWGRAIRRTNELEVVGTLIGSMAASNEVLGQQIVQNRSAVKEHLLSTLLKGEMESVEEWRARARDVGLTFEGSRFFVFILDIGSPDRSAKLTLIREVTAYFSAEVGGYAVNTLEEHRIIFAAATNDSEDELREWVTGLHRHLRDSCGIRLTLGTGRQYADIGLVGRSFIEASTAADYKLIRGNDKPILFMDVLADNPPSIVYPRQELERLSMLLKQGNTEQISQALASIADKIKTSSTTLFVARCLCYDIINTVMRTVYDMNAEFPEVKRTFPDVLTLMEFNTVEELAELISSACVDLCHAIRQHMAQPEGRLIEAMIDYVKTHYNDYDFSIGKLAAEFSLSVSYISRYFKEQTDRNITDFVNQLRIDQAKQLLLDDSRSVKEIVTLIGYSDVSSFIRKFKLLVGMTPGEYRKVFGHRLP